MHRRRARRSSGAKGSTWVAGYSRGQRWVHVQALGGEEMRSAPRRRNQSHPHRTEREGPPRRGLPWSFWAPYDLDLHRALQEETGLVVVLKTRPGPDPATSSPAWDFEPHEISRAPHRPGPHATADSWWALLVLLALSLLVGRRDFPPVEARRVERPTQGRSKRTGTGPR